MVTIPSQAPPPKFNNQNRAPQTREVYADDAPTERFRIPHQVLMDALPDDAPTTAMRPVQQNFRDRPIPQYYQEPLSRTDRKKKEKGPNRVALAVGSAVAGAAAVASLVLLGGKSGEPNAASDEHRRTETSQANYEQTQFNVYEREYDGSDYAVFLDSMMPVLLEKSVNTEVSGLPETTSLTGDKLWAQEVVNNISRYVATAFEEQSENTTLARNFLMGGYAPGNATLTEISKRIGNGSEAPIPRYFVVSVSDSYESGTIDIASEDIDFHSETVLVHAVNMNTSTESNLYITKQPSQSGAYEVPVITAIVQEGKPGFLSGKYAPDWNPVS